MKRAGQWGSLAALVLLLWCSLALANHAALRVDPQNTTPDPAVGTFITNEPIFHEHELPLVLGNYASVFIVSGGFQTATTNLSIDAFATVGYVPERVNQTSNLVTLVGAGGDTCWVILSSDNDGIAGDWNQEGTTAYYFLCAASTSRPALPANSTWLMRADINAGGATIDRTVRLINSMPIRLSAITGETDVRECGIVGDNVRNEDYELQLCIGDLADNHTLSVPGGLHIGIGNTITVYNKRNIKIKCEGAVTDQIDNSDGDGTMIVWNGVANGMAIDVDRSPGFWLEGCTVRNGLAGDPQGQARTFDTGINIDSDSAPDVTMAMTNPKFFNVRVRHSSSNANAAGIRIGDTGTNNNDFTMIVNSWFQINGGAGIVVDHNNAQGTKLLNSFVTNSSVGVSVRGGQVHIDGGMYNGNSQFVFEFQTQDGPSTIANTTAESIANVYLHMAAAGNGTVTMYNNMMIMDDDSATTIWNNVSNNSLTLINNRHASCANDGAGPCPDGVTVFGVALATSTLTSIGNTYPVAAPNFTAYSSYVSLMDKYWNATDPTVELTSRIVPSSRLILGGLSIQSITAATLSGLGTDASRIYYCSDCQRDEACTSGGNGAFVFFEQSGDSRCDALGYTAPTALDDTGTPSVVANSRFVTGGVTAITDFLGEVAGKCIYIIAQHNVQITDGANISLSADTNFTMDSDGGGSDTLHLCSVGGVWIEISRSVNNTP